MMNREIVKIVLLLSLIAGGACAAYAGEQDYTVVASSDQQWTGVAASKNGRMFVNYPNWSSHVPVSVAEIVDGKAVPFPDSNWNRRENPESFNAVQSVVIDGEDRLWVLETNNPQFKGVERTGPVLYRFSLDGELKAAFTFPKSVYRADSYFNDVRVDTSKEVAYITDSGHGALIVLDLKSGTSRRLLEGHPSVVSETDHLMVDGRKWKNSVDADGIALTPDSRYLYYIALTGHTLYRIETAALQDVNLSFAQLAKGVEKVAEVPATDGIMFDEEGNLWLGGLENNAVNKLDTKGKLKRVIQSPSISWADSFAMDGQGYIYFTTSQIHLPEEDRGVYRVIRIDPRKNGTEK